jgi:hypothetical protein
MIITKIRICKRHVQFWRIRARRTEVQGWVDHGYETMLLFESDEIQP